MYDVPRMHSQFATEQPGVLSAWNWSNRADGAAVAVVVAGHDDDGLLVVREVPEPRQRLAVLVHVTGSGWREALLLVGLRNRDLGQIDPIGLRVGCRGAEELVVRADRRRAVAFLRGPGGLPWRVWTIEVARS